MNPLQQASIRRKLWYFGAILALFTLSMLWRGEIRLPLALRELTDTTRWVDGRSILSQATRLQLRELDQGDPEVAGSAARLGLVGSRGVVITLLWYDAIEQQKRNDFHKLELRIKAVTTLQPHFITPWIFQSWNIAYNVSVEMQSLGDMYFYISRGIELLAEGERRNNRSPDMRYQIGFYYQNKFGVADQVQTLRCLFQLSCMPPGERDPKTLLTPEGAVDPKAFYQFCKNHPHLVRRLRGEERRDRDKKTTFEALQTRTPEDLVEFLRVNQKVPTRYKNATDLAPDDQQFPVFPKRVEETANATSSKETVDEAFSGYLAARAWFAAANTLAPPNKTDATGRPIPCGPPSPGEYDQFKYRLPRMPMLILFKEGPARAQTYQAELMEKDGWFDREGWQVDALSDDANAWFTKAGRRKDNVVIGDGTDWAKVAWTEAAQMWREYGEKTGMILDQSRKEQFYADADVRSEDSPQVGYLPEATPEQKANPQLMRQREAILALFFYRQNRQLTNFPHYLGTSEGEQLEDTIKARKYLWQANQARRVAKTEEALALYVKGLDLWKKVLLKNPAFHRAERSDRIEEETYEYELEYIRLLIVSRDKKVWDKGQEEYAKAAEQVGAFFPLIGTATRLPTAAQLDWNAMIAEKYFSPFGGMMPGDLPPGDPRAGGPWIRLDVKKAVLSRQGVITDKPAPAPPPQPGGMTPPPPAPPPKRQ